ncbi:Voltage-dependent calcium channel type A subunit alpha-1 [Durusdinium trenchii]|uniref:Voltage-dependent calcium channel type A subunit alpha-1 n=1 Tax=Durusdinium trenchii TaxID=1381693 RepID=A0ABP0Q1M8_9DINO
MQQAEVLKTVFQEIDICNSNEVTFHDVKDAISTPELAGFLESVGISTDDVWTFFMLLDQDRSGSIDLDEFVSGCLQLHGPAKSMQMAKMSFENKLTRQAIKHLSEDLQGMKQQLSSALPSKEVKEVF